MLVNDPQLARKMLEDQAANGNGAVKMFTGLNWYDDNGNPFPAQATIQQVLDDTDVMTTSQTAASKDRCASPGADSKPQG